MKGADVVLRLCEVDAGLAAVGRVDLRDDRRRDLDERHPALVGRRAEAGEVADDAAAQCNHDVGPGGAVTHHLRPDDLGVCDRLGLFAGHDPDAPEQRLERLAIVTSGVVVADQDPPAGNALWPEAVLADESLADVDRVVGRLAGRPQDADAVTRHPLERAQHAADLTRARRRDDHICDLLVKGGTARVELLEPGGIGRQRPEAAAVRDPPPSLVHVDVEPDDGRLADRVPDPVGAKRAAAEPDDTDRRVSQQLEGHPLLDLPKRCLTIAGEYVLDTETEPLLNHLIDVDRAGAERPRGGRLAGPHEANQRDLCGRRVRHRRRHAIRRSYAATAALTSSM